MMAAMQQNEATIFNIQKFTVHDGPGIRTSIYFKGCPLKCQWCFSPESISFAPQVAVFKEHCLGIDKCGYCLDVCPHNDEAVIKHENGIINGIDRNKCDNCLLCAQSCPNSTLKVYGEKYTVQQLMNIIMEDKAFYQDNNGGVTCTGGDPLVQYGFLKEFLKECNRYGIHTCLESELMCDRKTIETVMPHVDLWITDLKVMDSTKHKQFTSVSNEKIIANVQHLVTNNAKLIIRTPVVPGYNDDEENIHASARFVSKNLKNRIVQYQLLPYRTLGMDKYEALGSIYSLKELKLPDDNEYAERLNMLADLMKEYGVPAVVGSYTKY